MDLERVTFEGNKKMIDFISKALEEFPESTFGDIKIKVEGESGAFIKPAEPGEAMKQIEYPQGSTNQEIDVEHSTTTFKYNNLHYHISFYNTEEE